MGASIADRVTGERPPPGWAGLAACAWAVVFALMSLYWAAGAGITLYAVANFVQHALMAPTT